MLNYGKLWIEFQGVKGTNIIYDLESDFVLRILLMLI